MKKFYYIFSFLSITITFAQLPAHIPASGLQGYWEFNNNVSPTFVANTGISSSVRNSSGIVTTGDYTFNRYEEGFAAFDSGASKKSVQIESTDVNYDNGVSVSVWAKINSVEFDTDYKYSTIAGHRFSSGSVFNSFVLYLDYVVSTPTINARIGVGSSNVSISAPLANSVSSMWPSFHHFVLSYTKDNHLRLYVNGSLVATTNCSGAVLKASTPITLCSDNRAAQTFANIDIDNFALYNRGLTQNEVTQIYHSINPNDVLANYPSIPTSGLRGFWNFNKGLYDISGNGLHLKNNEFKNLNTTWTKPPVSNLESYTNDQNGNTNGAWTKHTNNFLLEYNGLTTLNDYPISDNNVNNLSFNTWIKPNYTTGTQTESGFLTKLNDDGSYTIMIGLVPDGFTNNYRFKVDINANMSTSPAIQTFSLTSAPFTITDINSWQMITVTFDRVAQSLLLYRNGVQIASSTLPTGLLGLRNTHSNTCFRCVLSFMNEVVSNKSPFPGTMDSALLYQSTLSPAQVLAIYNGTLSSDKIDNPIDFSIYPNPTNSIFEVKIPNETIKIVRIYDLAGKEIMITKQELVDASDFPEGIYIVKIEKKKKKTGVSKLIKK